MKVVYITDKFELDGVDIMPSAITHAAVGVAASLAFGPQNAPSYFWTLSVICATVPDGDVLGLPFRVPYRHFFGHRGFFHSFFFCFILAFCLATAIMPGVDAFSRTWFFYLVFFFIVSASHGILDMFTNGSLGVALLSPFDTTRYLSPWRPIVVSPISLKSFFSSSGLAVIRNEVLWVWVPASFVTLSSLAARMAPVRVWLRLFLP
jgi:inner membrane protein